MMERWPPGAWCEGALRARGAPTSTCTRLHRFVGWWKRQICSFVTPLGSLLSACPPLMPAETPESRARLAEGTDPSCGGCPGAVWEPQG